MGFLDRPLNGVLFLHDAGRRTTHRQMQSPLQLPQMRYAAAHTSQLRRERGTMDQEDRLDW
jgi:hypothetical protein